MKRVPYIGQVQESECGICCIAMILTYYENCQTVKSLTNIIEIGRDGVSFSDLKMIFKNYKFKADFYEVSISRLSEINDKPLIVYWNNNHYIILEKIKNDIFYIVDPNLGRLKLSFEDFKKGFCNIVLRATPTEDSIKNKKKNNPWKIYSTYFKENIYKVFFVLFMACLSYMIVLIIPNIIQSIIDSTQDGNITILSDKTALLTLGLIPLFLLVYVLKSKSIIRFSAHMDNHIYYRLIDKLFKVPYKFFLTRNSSDLLYRINLVKANREFFIETIISGIIDFGMILIIAIILSVTSKFFLYYIVVISFILTCILLFIRKYIVMKNKEEIIEGTKLQGLEYETLSAMFTLKATAQEEYMKQLVYKQYKKTLKKFKQRNFINNYYVTVIQGFTYFGPLILFIISMGLYKNNIISLGKCIFSYTMCGFYFSSVANVFASINVFGTMRNNLERIEDILEQKTEDEEEKHNKATVQDIQNIEFKNIYFKYPGQKKYVLKDLNIAIKKGTKTAIVGRTGSGKSTIAGLILGMFEPDKGSIIVNGIEIDSINIDSLKKNIGYVPQEPFIFNKSIKENIKMNRDISDENVVESAKIVRIHDEIMQMPMKYETVISELGHNISGGQKQRIILARAIVLNPSLIILDEATSSIDNQTESLISEYFNYNENTQIIIAHRLSTIVNADNIIVVEDGRVVGQGTHEDLLKSSIVYQKLYNKERTVTI